MRVLVGKEFVAATPMQGIFWINPAYIWNGDKLAFIKEYRKAGRTTSKPAIERDPNTRDWIEESGA